jgi:hypothetical protein
MPQCAARRRVGGRVGVNVFSPSKSTREAEAPSRASTPCPDSPSQTATPMSMSSFQKP